MPMQKSRLHRLMQIAAELKENRYPNSETLVKKFRKIAEEEGIEIDCVKKTILRDMKILKDEFHCPLAFDRGRNGYYLKHHGWDFTAPALLDENEMLAAVIGARIAENIFPPPLKNKIRNAVDYLLRTNNPDFLDQANMETLSILSGLYISIDPEIFITVFNGWMTHHCVKIAYVDFQDNISERIIEPHALVFYQNSWYCKAFCHLKSAPRTFALHRIKNAKLLNGDFEVRKNIVKSVNNNDFLAFAKEENIELKVRGSALDRLRAAPLHSRQTIDSNGMVKIPAVSKEVLFPFIYAQRGEAELIAPEALRNELKAELAAMLKAY